MCGIAGLFRPRSGSMSPTVMATTVRTMTDTLNHRGPDGEGLWSDAEGRCVLGHRRLSIIDTSNAGLQPMKSGDGRYVITFNGELYNFAEVRASLEADGVLIRGRTDTEVLLEAFVHWGLDALNRFDGMFAFAVFDTVNGELFLARDPFGEKPLYYTRLRSGAFAFASELQALEKAPGFDARVDPATMAEVLSFQYIGAPRSIYSSVRKLRPGSWMRVEASGRTTSKSYFAFRPGQGGFTDRPMADLADELEELLAVSLRRRLISDVPLGAFLSGGVDSATVCAVIARKLGRPLMTFSMGFENAPESELLTAQAFAEHLGTMHRASVISPEVSSFLEGIGSILDEPNGDSSCLPTYMLSQFAREHVTVAVSGDGGDEMFAGYGRYFSTMNGEARHRAGDMPGWTPGWNYYGSSILVSSDQDIESLFGTVPRRFTDHLGLLRARVDDEREQLLCELRRTDTENYLPGAVLPKVDRMSMRHGLEVRTPFLSRSVSNFAERLPDSVLVGDRGKLILREVAYRYLPRHLIDLPKQGFALPMSDWARASLLDTARKLMGSTDSRMRAALGSAGIDRFLERQSTPGTFAPYQLWGVVMLESWMRHHPVEIESQTAECGYVGQSLAPKTMALRVLPIDRDMFLIRRTDAGSCDPPTARTVNPDLMIRATELAVRDDALNLDSSDEFDLPDWGEPATEAHAHELERFYGATVIFLDAEASIRFSATASEQFRQAGVARVVFQRAFGAPGVLELIYRYHRGWRHLSALATLFRCRIAAFSTRWWARLIPRTRSLRTTGGHALESGLVRAVDALPDVELCTRFMAFQGLRQLPPVVAGHALIAEEGDGRYSVFDQVVTISSVRSASPSELFWLVRSTPRTTPLLPIAVQEGPLSRFTHAQVERLIKPAAHQLSATLRPGDSIVVCTHSLVPGGAERQWVYLARSLHEAGYDVTFVVYQPLEGEGAHYLPVLLEAGICVLDASAIPLAEQIRLWPKDEHALALLRADLIPDRDKLFALVAAFARVAPRAIFSQLDEPNLFAGFAAEVISVPLHVMSFRNYNPQHFSYLNKDWYRTAYRVLAQRTGCLLTGNHDGANRDYADWIGVPEERVHRVANVLDPEDFPQPTAAAMARARHELGLAEGTPLVVGVFRLSSEKDPGSFIEVCAKVLRERPDAMVLIAGVGPLGTQIVEQIEEHALADRILMLGRRSDINVLLGLASVCLLTSRYEGTPNILMEAQLIGVPVVATRVGGVPAVVVEGRTALLHEIGDVEGLAASCLALLNAPEHARAMGQAGRQHLLTAFPRQELVRNYESVIAGTQMPISSVLEEISIPS